jgi:hypothetical protein
VERLSSHCLRLIPLLPHCRACRAGRRQTAGARSFPRPRAAARYCPRLRHYLLTHTLTRYSPTPGTLAPDPASPLSRFALHPVQESKKPHVRTNNAHRARLVLPERRSGEVIRPSVPSAEPIRHLSVMRATTRTSTNEEPTQRPPTTGRPNRHPSERHVSYQGRPRSSTAIVISNANSCFS